MCMYNGAQYIEGQLRSIIVKAVHIAVSVILFADVRLAAGGEPAISGTDMILKCWEDKNGLSLSFLSK